MKSTLGLLTLNARLFCWISDTNMPLPKALWEPSIIIIPSPSVVFCILISRLAMNFSNSGLSKIWNKKIRTNIRATHLFYRHGQPNPDYHSTMRVIPRHRGGGVKYVFDPPPYFDRGLFWKKGRRRRKIFGDPFFKKLTVLKFFFEKLTVFLTIFRASITNLGILFSLWRHWNR